MPRERELVLSVKRSLFRHDDPEADHHDAAFRSVAGEVKERDRHTCVYCGFQARRFQEVHHLDDNHGNNDPSNLVTTCPLCHAVNHIGFAARRNAGTLIYINPSLGLTQAGLNALVRALWVLERCGSRELQMTAIGFLARLNRLSVPARRHFGVSDPGLVADFLLGLSDEDYARRSQALAGLYFFPSPEAFSEALSYWCQSVYSKMPGEQWPEYALDKTHRWLGVASEYEVAEQLGLMEQEVAE